MTMQQNIKPHYIRPRQGMWFHCFVTNAETGKKAYLGAYQSEEEARQHSIEAVGIEGNYDIFQSRHYDQSIVKQEYKHKKFIENGNLWGNLKPIKNLGRKGRE